MAIPSVGLQCRPATRRPLPTSTRTSSFRLSLLASASSSVEVWPKASAGPLPSSSPPPPTLDKAGIYVPRQRYIAVPKADLVRALLSLFSAHPSLAHDFSRFAKCLDAILHAEHKELLEEMRAYYSLANHAGVEEPEDGAGWKNKNAVPDERNDPQFAPSVASDKTGDNTPTNVEDEEYFQNLYKSLDLKSMFGLSPSTAQESRVAFATHFQVSFMKLLRDAQFEELSERDLLLTYALNNDYLLTLPIFVDWKRAAESNAIIFRRGYATERQKGLLLVEKLDYLQSKLLRKIFYSFSMPMMIFVQWINEALKRSTGKEEFPIWIDRIKTWLKEQYFPESWLAFPWHNSNEKIESAEAAEMDLPMWIAAQKAVSRYQGFLSPLGPRGRLFRRLLTWIGLIPAAPEASIISDIDKNVVENYARPSFLPRITLSNIWEPASSESCTNIWEKLKVSIHILFQQSTLQEPAFQELILLYTDKAAQKDDGDRTTIIPVQLKIYERIPIPDLPVVFPHKKLSFRILDTVRLDLATIIGLLAYFVNYKFENIASSPSAILLDAVTVTSLIILVFRVALGYRQTWDRYQLLVNKTLYEKTLASGFGSVHFLIDASEQQLFKEAVLVYAILLCSEKYETTDRHRVSNACEQFVRDAFKEKIEMPIDKAMETLMRLGLVRDDDGIVSAVPCWRACEILRGRWDGLLEAGTAT